MSDNGNTSGTALERFRNMTGPDIVLEVVRGAEALERDGTEVTISPEALDVVRSSLTLWVASRIMRALDNGQAPQTVTVRVVVKLDGRLAE